MRQQVHHAIFGVGQWRNAVLRLPPWVFCVLLVACLLSARGSTTRENKPTQYEVEAAYLFDFGKFVVWPAAVQPPNSPFLICVLGEDPFGPVLDRTVGGETLNGRPAQHKHITHLQDATVCSILYISNSESGRLSKILSAIQEVPVLTVSDIPDFVQQGGMIQFVLREGRVRFEVNLAPTQKNGLSMSSELLKVAVRVLRGGSSH
jgi:hypothetical protein